ncbi:MAG: YfhO family protein [Acidobacteriota bacterium]
MEFRILASVAARVQTVQRSNWGWVVLIVLLNVVFFGDALFTGQTFFVRDVSFFHYPLKHLVTEAYSNGEWPLWNPYIQMGQPLLANPNSMALYPTQILFQTLPFDLAFDLHFVLHTIMAGLAVFFLAREFGIGQVPAFAAACIYNFCGITLSFVNLFNILPAAAWLPFLAWLSIRQMKGGSLLELGLTSLSFGCFFLLLEPLSLLAAALFLTIIGGAFLFWADPPKLRPVAAMSRILIAVSSGVLLASVQILPTWELIQNSGRKGGLSYDVIAFWSQHPVALIQLVVPRFFGEYFRLSHPAPWGNVFFDGREPYLLSCYLGGFVLLLAGLGVLTSQKRWLALSLFTSCAVALTLALGKHTPVLEWLFDHVPLFRYGRYPVKYLYVVALSGSLLAGLGLESLDRLRMGWKAGDRESKLRGRLLLSGIGLVLLVSSALWFDRGIGVLTGAELGSGQLLFQYQGETLKLPRAIFNEALRHLQLHLVVFLVFLVLVGWENIRIPIVRTAAIMFLLFDAFISNFWINPVISGDFYETAPAAAYLRKRLDEQPFRVYSWEPDAWRGHPPILGQSDSVAWVAIFRKLSLYQFLAAKDHIQYSVFNPIDRLETLNSQQIGQELRQAAQIDDKLRILTELNVGYVLSVTELESSLLSLDALFELNSSQPLRIYRLNRFLPRAVLLEPPHNNPLDAGQGVGGSSVSEVEIKHYSPSQVVMEASALRRGQLVLLDSAYPGWKALLDGEEQPIFTVGHGFRGIDFPEGRHSVQFVYRPASFYRGLMLSLGALATWIAVLVIQTIWRIRRPVNLNHASRSA